MGLYKVEVGFIVGMFVLLVSVGAAVHYGTQATVTATVTDKERIVERDSDGGIQSKYLVFTDKETFENTDSLWALKFNSSDLYGKLQEGQTCEFDVVGFRVSWMSMYRNILDARCE